MFTTQPIKIEIAINQARSTISKEIYKLEEKLKEYSPDHWVSQLLSDHLIGLSYLLTNSSSWSTCRKAFKEVASKYRLDCIAIKGLGYHDYKQDPDSSLLASARKLLEAYAKEEKIGEQSSIELDDVRTWKRFGKL